MPKLRAITVGLTALTILGTPATASARDYYVSPTGNDAASASASAPWRTLSKVNSAALAPGDNVLLQGGAVFSGTLSPTRSGSTAAPITYKSYGTGKPTITGGVFTRSVSNLAFQDLKVDGASQAFRSSSAGTGAKNLTFLRTEARNNVIGFNAPSTLDQNWSIKDCVIDRIQDTGVHSWAADTRVENCKISNVGLGAASYSYSLHGMYVKGARFRAIGNEIWNNSDDTGQAISTRYRDALIENNYIHDVYGGIGYFRDDSGEGTTTIRRNRFANIPKSVIYIGAGNRAPGVGENFHIYNNTAINTAPSTRAAFNWAGTGGKEFIFRNNAVSGYKAVVQTLTGVQQSNNVLGNLGVTNFVPQTGSRLLNTGTTTIKSGTVSFVNGCTGATLSYCGTAPEVGAVEKP